MKTLQVQLRLTPVVRQAAAVRAVAEDRTLAGWIKHVVLKELGLEGTGEVLESPELPDDVPGACAPRAGGGDARGGGPAEAARAGAVLQAQAPRLPALRGGDLMPAPQDFWQVLAGVGVLWALLAGTAWLVFVARLRGRALRDGADRKKRLLDLQARGLGDPTPGGRVGIEGGDPGPSDADLAATEAELHQRWRQGGR